MLQAASRPPAFCLQARVARTPSQCPSALSSGAHVGAGMMACSSYYPMAGYHSLANPHACATVFDPPTCGGRPIAPRHTLAHFVCPNGPNSCGAVTGTAGSAAHLVMYMQYEPGHAACEGSVVAYAAPCEKDDLGRPSVAFVNWCPAAQLHLRGELLQMHTEVGVHEVLHALGYSANSWTGQYSDPAVSHFLAQDGSRFLPMSGARLAPGAARGQRRQQPRVPAASS